MCLPYKILKTAVCVSGFLILLYSAFCLFFTGWITVYTLNSTDSFSGSIGLFILFLWGLCATVLSMVYCAIKGAKTENKDLLRMLFVDCFIYILINLITLPLITEFLIASIILIIFIVMFVIIIIITFCFISHPENEKKIVKIRSQIYDQNAQYLIQQKS